MRLTHTVVKHKKSSVFILIGILAFTGISILLNRLEQPASVPVVIGRLKSNQSEFNVNLAPVPYKDSFVAFNFPKGLSRIKSSPLAATDIDIITFSAQDLLSWTLAIDVTNTGSKALYNDSSYRLRLDQPSIYKLSNITIHNQSIPIMTDTTASGFSEVAFLQHANLRATVALRGDDAAGVSPLQTTWNMVLDSWHWQ